MKLEHSLDTYLSFKGVKVIVNRYMLDDRIVLRRPKNIRFPGRAYEAFAIYHISIWDLDKGEVYGDCNPREATEMHMSPYRFDKLKRMIEEYEKDWNLDEDSISGQL